MVTNEPGNQTFLNRQIVYLKNGFNKIIHPGKIKNIYLKFN